jgi:large subunit ribosomal protein L2
MNPPRRSRRVGRFAGKRAQVKKAVVRLAEGNAIQLFLNPEGRNHMAIRNYRPITPGTRTACAPATSPKSRAAAVSGAWSWPSTAARAATTVASSPAATAGGGHKRLYRIVDFRRDKHGVVAEVGLPSTTTPTATRGWPCSSIPTAKSVTSSPPLVLSIGQQVVSGPDAQVENGNALPLSAIPLGSSVHDVELYAGRGGQMVAAGAMQVMAKAIYVALELP